MNTLTRSIPRVAVHDHSVPISVGIAAPLQEPIPGVSGNDEHIKYGGTERVVACLVKGLVNLGVVVHLFAAGNSSREIKDLCEFHAILPHSLRQTPPFDKDPVAREYQAFLCAMKSLVLARELGVDIIHNHIGGSAAILSGMGLTLPMLTTLHGDLNHPAERIYADERLCGLSLVSVSNSQRRGSPLNLNFVGTVYNPIPTNIFIPRYEEEAGGEYLVWLGRFAAEKRPHVAMDVAAELNVPIRLAGKREVHEREYWKCQIEPRLQRYGNLVKCMGEVNDRQKNRLLRGAHAFLMPINWQEPFGLVVGEALACGTPVVATSMGSMPELIDDGVTGYLVDPSESEASVTRAFAQKVKLCGALSRRICRKQVEDRFSIQRCATEYLKLYRQVLAEQKTLKTFTA